MSVIISSRMAQPSAPVPRFKAFCAMAFSASFSIVRRTLSNLEEPLVLLDQGVLRLDEDAGEQLVEGIERNRDREPSHEPRDRTIAKQVIRSHR